MPNLAHQNDVKIDRVHSDAICEEIGERLSAALAPPPNELPPRLLTLMDNLRRLTRSKSSRWPPALSIVEVPMVRPVASPSLS